MAVYTLPDMPYDYGALEPAMSGEILELHHSKHHAAYVKGSNDALDQLAEAREKGDYTTLVGLEKTFAFNLSGHVLHSIFWNNLSPDGGDRPDGELAAAIDEHLGSFEAFAGQLSAATKGVQGSGWGCSPGSRSASGSSSSRSTTTTATSGRAVRRSWSSTPGSTPTTCSTATSARTTSTGSGAW